MNFDFIYIMSRIAAISASDVLNLLFHNEGAGQVSDDELPDQVEFNSEDEDEITANEYSTYTNLEPVNDNPDFMAEAILLENNLMASNCLISSIFYLNLNLISFKYWLEIFFYFF